MTIGQPHLVVLGSETLVSVAINALIPTAIIWAIGVSPPGTLLGVGQLVHGMTMASGLATFAMTLAVTLIVRARVRRRPALAEPIGGIPAIVRWLPRPLMVRMVAMGLVAMIVLVPLGAAAAALSGILPLGPRGFLTFNLIYGTVVGLTMTPAVVLRAFADRAVVI